MIVDLSMWRSCLILSSISTANHQLGEPISRWPVEQGVRQVSRLSRIGYRFDSTIGIVG
jgi:hypothetical protein